MNPMNMIKTMLMGKQNPKQIAMELLKQNNNPMLNNLVQMAEKGDTKGVENFARNFFKEQGKDFDKEYSLIMNNFK